LLILVNSPLVARPVLSRARAQLSARLEGAVLGDSFSVSPIGNVRLGPLTLGEKSSPTLQVETLVVRPRLWAILTGKLELAALTLVGVKVDAGEQGQKLEVLARSLQGARTARQSTGRTAPVPLPTVYFRKLHVRGSLGPPPARGLSMGPVNGLVRGERGGQQRRVDVVIEPPGGGALRVELTHQADRLVLRGAAEGLGAGIIPPEIQEILPVQITRARMDGKVTVDYQPSSGSGKTQLEGAWSDVYVRGERLGSGEIGPLTMHTAATVRMFLENGRLKLEQATLRVGEAQKVQLDIEGELIARGEPRFELKVRAPNVEYPALVDSLPPALRPGEEVPRLPGTLGLSLEISGPPSFPALWTVGAALDLEALRKATRGQPFYLNGPFTHRAQGQGQPRTVRVGADNPHFVPVGELPEHLLKAVTVSEDAGFWGHAGFDFSELKNAFAQGAEAGRIVRGGSTISQQLAKNLFLSREKTLARKAQEALATVALEAACTKRRLLEIYVNLIEWGPNIYGIGEAAKYYFGKDARDLTVKESVFLATIIPNPVRYHVYFARKSLTETWEKRVNELLQKLNNIGFLSDEELDAARMEPLQFAQG
jgi:penicillin-binding protein 1A